MKVIFFTASDVPTGAETTAIAALQARVSPAYEVAVRNALKSQSYGHGLETCDYKAGTPPASYSATPTVPAIGQVITQGQAVTGVTMTGTAGAGKTATFTVVAGVITAIAFT